MAWCGRLSRGRPDGPKTHKRVFDRRWVALVAAHTPPRAAPDGAVVPTLQEPGRDPTRDKSELVRHLREAMDSGDLPKKPVVDLLAAHMQGEFDKTQLMTQLKAQVGEAAFNEAIQKRGSSHHRGVLVATINRR